MAAVLGIRGNMFHLSPTAKLGKLKRRTLLSREVDGAREGANKEYGHNIIQTVWPAVNMRMKTRRFRHAELEFRQSRTALNKTCSPATTVAAGFDGIDMWIQHLRN